MFREWHVDRALAVRRRFLSGTCLVLFGVHPDCDTMRNMCRLAIEFERLQMGGAEVTAFISSCKDVWQGALFAAVPQQFAGGGAESLLKPSSTFMTSHQLPDSIKFKSVRSGRPSRLKALKKMQDNKPPVLPCGRVCNSMQAPPLRKQQV